MKKLNTIIDFLNSGGIKTVPYYELSAPISLINIPLLTSSLDEEEIKSIKNKFSYLKVEKWNLEIGKQGFILSIPKKYFIHE